MLVSIQRKDKRQIEERSSQLLRNLSSYSSGLNKIRTHDLCDAGIAEVMSSNTVQAWISSGFLLATA